MTVSRVLNNKGEISSATRERVQRIIGQLNYRPSAVARSLVTRQTETLGFILPDIANPFFPEVLRGADDLVSEQGYALLLYNTVEDQVRERKILDLLDETRVDGVILCSSRLSDDELKTFVQRFPASVLINRPTVDGAAGSVCIDSFYGAMRAVNHLLSAGRGRIGFLAGPPQSYSARQRAHGYQAALETNGKNVDPSFSVTCAPNEEAGFDATLELLRRHSDLNGLICFNDLVAVGAIQACANLEKQIPEDIAIVGFDDIRIASLMTPALTTLTVSKHDLGAKAAQLLLDYIKSGKRTSTVMMRPSLMVRASAPS